MADANKTERATPHRRQKAREQGSVVRSRELTAVFATAGAAGGLMLFGQSLVPHWSGLYRELLDCAMSENIEPGGPILFWCTVEVLRSVAPVLLLALLASLGAGLAQGGLVIAPAALALKPERLNPATKLGQLFSPMGLSQLLKSLVPFAAMAAVGWTELHAHWSSIVVGSGASMRAFSSLLGSVAFAIAWKSALVLLLWSGVDYLLTRQKTEGDMKMSKEDVKEENKQQDGNPQIKMRIRRLRRSMRKRFSRKAVATATVVVTNPTHYAVALRYENAMAAPIVVEKGLDLIALEIREIAAEHNIPVMENRPLAQALYKSVEVGDAIPAALYQAVADILVVVYRAQAELRAEEARRRSRDASGRLVKS
jgi:flagellar biosynthesis protein FlhB